jgi:uncharacterized membrane protein YdjX (TVP38/TMEM64 family)
MGASYIRFVLVRSIGRNWVGARLPERFRHWDDRLLENSLQKVVMMRLFFNLAAPADWILALSRINTAQFLLGTIVGRVPVTIVWVWAGGGVLGWLEGTSTFLWPTAIASGLIVAVFVSSRPFWRRELS